VSPTPALQQAERVRRLVAPAVAFFASALALCCLVTVPDVASGWPALVALEPAFAAWAGLGIVLAVAITIVLLLGASRLGSGPPLALGLVSAVVGLALSHDIGSGPQLVLALLTLSVAIGALLASGLSLSDELPGAAARRRVFVCWLAPLSIGWPVLGWLSLRERASSALGVGLHPPAWLIAVGVVLVLGWAVLTVATEPPRPAPAPVVGWENAWAALGVLTAAAASVTMLIGFQPNPHAPWVRPVVLLTTALVFIGLLACARLIPDGGERPSYLAVVTALIAGPVSLQLLALVAWQARDGLPWWTAAVPAAAAAAGCWTGCRRPRSAEGAGLLVMALATVGGWVLPSVPILMCAAATPLAFGLSATVSAAMHNVAAARMPMRFVAAGATVAILFGLLAAAPLAWALGSPLSGRFPAARDGGRVLLGLAFAAFVLASAAVAVLRARAGRQSADGLASCDETGANIPQSASRR
jgi:hypothetical protein